MKVTETGRIKRERTDVMRRILVILLVVSVTILSGCQSVSKGSFGELKKGLNRGSFGEFKKSLNTKQYGYAIVEDFTGNAPTPFIEKFEVRPGDCAEDIGWSDCAKDRERSELSGPKDNYRGTEYWYGWSLYIPEDYPNVYPTKTALGQFHQKNGPPAFMFQTYSGGYYIDRNFGSTSHVGGLIPKKEFKGKWHQIEVHAKWHNADGFFIVFVDGVEQWRFKGKTMSYSTQAVFFKYGVYRSFMTRYKNRYGVDKVPAQTAYFANVKRAKTREGLLP